MLTINSSHPDLFWLGDENREKEVTIENIRSATEFLGSKPIISKRKLLCINLNKGFSYNAVSAILKILEEPPDNSYLVIRIDNLGKLPKTIISRCQILDVAQPTCEMVKKWYESQFSKQINDQSINGFCSASYFLAPQCNDGNSELYRVGDIMTGFLWSLCHETDDFDSFPEKINDYDCDSILSGVELTIYLIILAQYQQKPSTIFVDQRKKNELKILGQKSKQKKLFNLLGHIAYLKRLCFNMQGVKASDISDLIFTNAIKEIFVKNKVLSLSIKDKSSLYASYMPFLENGGIFIPSEQTFELGEEVFMLVNLVDDNEKIPLSGKIVWIDLLKVLRIIKRLA